MDPLSAETRNQYDALRSAAGVASCGRRTQIEMTGKDRATFLHGFCTNDIKGLKPGQGCEAFLTNVQGKATGLVNVYCEQDRLVVDTVAGQAEHIIQSLDRYLIREDVQLIDRSEHWHELLVSGPDAARLIGEVVGVAIDLAPRHHLCCQWQGHAIAVRRVDYAGQPDYFLGLETAHWPQCWDAIVQAKAIPCDADALEIARIEAGTPLFGRDISDENLPQEVDRNATAISFTKGCYLGQETIARLDALGHVNRLLRGVRFNGDHRDPNDVLPPDSELTHDGKVVARVTSACWSFHLQAPLALAYVRRECATPGTRLAAADGDAEVVNLPLA